MIIIGEHVKEETKLYLCDGYGCDLAYPEVCYKNGGECIHTAYSEHSIKKKLGDIFPETIWRDHIHGELQIEDVDSAQVLKHFQKVLEHVLEVDQ
jgi:hypothetical protein